MNNLTFCCLVLLTISCAEAFHRHRIPKIPKSDSLVLRGHSRGHHSNGEKNEEKYINENNHHRQMAGLDDYSPNADQSDYYPDRYYDSSKQNEYENHNANEIDDHILNKVENHNANNYEDHNPNNYEDHNLNENEDHNPNENHNANEEEDHILNKVENHNPNNYEDHNPNEDEDHNPNDDKDHNANNYKDHNPHDDKQNYFDTEKSVCRTCPVRSPVENVKKYRALIENFYNKRSKDKHYGLISSINYAKKKGNEETPDTTRETVYFTLTRLDCMKDEYFVSQGAENEYNCENREIEVCNNYIVNYDL